MLIGSVSLVPVTVGLLCNSNWMTWWGSSKTCNSNENVQQDKCCHILEEPACCLGGKYVSPIGRAMPIYVSLGQLGQLEDATRITFNGPFWIGSRWLIMIAAACCVLSPSWRVVGGNFAFGKGRPSAIKRRFRLQLGAELSFRRRRVT